MEDVYEIDDGGPPDPLPFTFTKQNEGRPKGRFDVDLLYGDIGFERDGGTDERTRWRTPPSRRIWGAVVMVVGVGIVAAVWGISLLLKELETGHWVLFGLMGFAALVFLGTGLSMILQRVSVTIDHRSGEVIFERTIRWAAPKQAVVRLADLRAFSSHRIREVSGGDHEDWTVYDVCVGELKDGRLVQLCVNCPAFEKDVDTALRRLKGMPPAEDWVEPA